MTSAIARPPDEGPLLFNTPQGLLSDAKPGTLYHYTDQHGLLGILRTGRIWATSIQFLNDAREYKLGLKRIGEELQERTKGDEELAEMLPRSLDVTVWGTPTVGVVSFSEMRDDLGQWRAYGRGTGGYSIGFHGDVLMRRINAGSGVLVPVVYAASGGTDPHKAIITSLCDEIVEAARALTENPAEQQRFQARCNLSVQVICSILKDGAFHQEHEWRGIFLGPAGSRVQFCVRPGQSTLIPYYDAKETLIR